MRAFISKPPVLAGVSIQPENIHLVQLTRTKTGYLLGRVLQHELPAEIYSEGKIIAFDVLQEKLSHVVEAAKLRSCKVVACVPANQVRMQRIVMPAGLSERDIEAEVSAAVYRALPQKAGTMAIDYYMQPASVAEEVSVFFAAARKDYIDCYRACLESAGLQVMMMDVDIFALLRAARYALQYVLCSDEKIAVLYLGEHYAVMAAGQSNEILFHQQWDGASVSRLAMTRMQWVEWCCHTYRQSGVTSLAIGGSQTFIHQAAKIVAAHWSCKTYEPDPFLKMTGLSGQHQAAISDSPSLYLLAWGLAMRELLPW